MITKIIIDNFMAHEHTELELGPGVTILTGANNTGKSAVVEALRCLATNPLPKPFIRHGAKEARVAVELDDGTKVVWIRKKRSSGYELWRPGADEPEEYWKFGRKPPEDIRDILKMDLVDLEHGDPVDIHIGNQRNPIFLLDQPGSNAAAFFAASTESAHLLAMQNLLKSQTIDAKRHVRGLEGDITRIENEINTLAPLPGIKLQVDTARELERAALELERGIPALESTLHARRELSATIRSSQKSLDALHTVIQPPNLNDTGQLGATINGLDRISRLSVTAESTAGVLKTLATMPKIETTYALADLIEKIGQTGGALQKIEVQDSALREVLEPPTQHLTKGLSEFIDEFIASHYRMGRVSRWDDALRNLVEPPTVEATGEMLAMVSEMTSLEAGVGKLKSTLSTLGNELRRVEEAMAERIGELGCCPTCGNELTTQSFLDHGCRNET